MFWWLRISITTHYNRIHIIRNCHPFRFGGHLGNTLKTYLHPHHDSLGAAASAFCVNYTEVRLHIGAASLCVNKQWQRIGKPPLH